MGCGDRMHVLLVDDEKLALEVMDRMIDREKQGISVLYKTLNMSQAQRICEETEIDIAICDIEMPRGSGLDFVKWLLETGRNPVVIFLTSHAVFSYAQQAVSLGVQDYLLKPVEPEDMDRALKKAVREAQERRKHFRARRELAQLDADRETAERNVERVRQYIEEHFREPLTRELLAAMVFMNPDYLAKLFKRRYGASLMDYVTKMRIACAREMLEYSSLSVSEIALEIGYSNTAHFTKMFKKYAGGVTPRAYRKAVRVERDL